MIELNDDGTTKMCEFFDHPVCDCGSETGSICTFNFSLGCQWANERREKMNDYVDDLIEQEEKAARKPLYEFYVAGIQHHKLHTCIKEIKVGDVLTLTPEPSNRFDPNAIRIEYPSLNQDAEIMLGYVPKAKGDFSSKVSAAMMIRRLRCEVLELKPEAKTWEQLKVAIFDEDERPGEEG